jgi:hypothetical protein
MNPYNFKLTGHSNGPGMTATVVLDLLLAELVNKNVLSSTEVQALMLAADSIIKGMGEDYSAVKDARAVLNGMRGL